MSFRLLCDVAHGAWLRVHVDSKWRGCSRAGAVAWCARVLGFLRAAPRQEGDSGPVAWPLGRVAADLAFVRKTLHAARRGYAPVGTAFEHQYQGSGNGVAGVGAAQTVCCFGNDVQCCGMAAAAATAQDVAAKMAKAVHAHEAGATAVGAKCSRAPRSLARVSESTMSSSVVGDNNKVTTFNVKGSGKEYSRALQDFRRFVVDETKLVQLDDVLFRLRQMTRGQDSWKQLAKISMDNADSSPWDVCWRNGWTYICHSLCKNGLVPPTAKCNDIRKLIEEDTQVPKNWQGWYTRGLHERRAEEKKHCFLKALEDNPNISVVWSSLGMVGGGPYRQRQRMPTECFEKALKLDAENADAWFQLGQRQGGRVKNEWHAPQDCYAKAVAVKDDFSEAWNALGEQGGGLVSGRNFSKRACFEKALAANKSNARAWNNLGLEGGGHVREEWFVQKDCFRMALDHDPQNETLWGNFCMCGGGVINGTWWRRSDCESRKYYYATAGLKVFQGIPVPVPVVVKKYVQQPETEPETIFKLVTVFVHSHSFDCSKGFHAYKSLWSTKHQRYCCWKVGRACRFAELSSVAN